MNEQTGKKVNPQQIIIDQSLRTVWVDHMILAKRLDGMTCARLSTNLPEGLTEQIRFMTSEQHLKEFVNVLCTNLNYYPDKKSIAKDIKVEVIDTPPKSDKTKTTSPKKNTSKTSAR